MAAASIQKQLVALGLKNNGILYRNSAVGSRYPDKSKADYYAVIKRSKYAGFPGLIVEHAYVSNHDDSTTFLNGNDRLKRLGVADATGIAEYFDLILDQAPVLQTPQQILPQRQLKIRKQQTQQTQPKQQLEIPLK